MRIEIHQDASVSTELKRVAFDLSGAALMALRQRSEFPKEALHESRKTIRSVRVLLRLHRKALGEHDYAEGNGLLRKLRSCSRLIAMPMCAWRQSTNSSNA